MKITVDGSVFEGTPEEIKEMMTLMGAEFPEKVEDESGWKKGDKVRHKLSGEVVEVYAYQPEKRTVGLGAGHSFNNHKSGFTYIDGNGFEYWTLIRHYDLVEEESETKPKTEKRKARVGERILITKAEAPGGQYKNGDILTVSKEFGKLGSPRAIQAEGINIGIYHDEYEVIVEESTPKFKVGDRARIKTAVGALAGFTSGDVVEIRALGRDSVNDVEVYGKSHGTTGYTTSENLEELTNEFREGDRVKALAYGQFGDIIEGEIGTIYSSIEDDVDSYNIAVKTADDYDYFRPQDLELVTEEREGVRGFKKGDIVSDGTGTAMFTVLSGYEIETGSVSFPGSIRRNIDEVKLVAPVESRVDL